MTDRRPLPVVRRDLAVILCTYNGSSHVAEQVRSILRQTVLPGEIRVYDDGSTDGTLDVVRSTWEGREARARTVGLHLAPPAGRSFGASPNFARAMLDSPEPILALSDQDDEWLPDRLESAVEILDTQPAIELVASDATMTDGTGAPVGRTVFETQRLTMEERAQFQRGEYLPALLRRNLVPGMTFTLRRSLFEALGPLPDGTMHDYWLATAAAARGTLRITPRPLVRYRIHGANAVGLDTGRRSARERIAIKVRHFRAPLTDLPQWVTLPERLRRAGDETAASRLLDKRRFEIDRRHNGRSAFARAASTARLLRGEDYLTFDFQGRAAGLRDAIRHPDPFLGEATDQ